ncbi:hypothetical protein Tco_0516446 [Tanacetum coccineum]
MRVHLPMYFPLEISNKKRKLNPTEKAEKAMKDYGLGFHLAHGVSLDVDDPVDFALAYREKMMTLKDFLHFLGNRLASFSTRPADVPISVGSPVGSSANILNEELEMAVAALVANNAVGAEVVPPSVGQHWHVFPDIAPSDEACKTLFRSLASTKDPGDSAEVVPPFAGRHWRGVFARPIGSQCRVIAPSLDVDLKGKRVVFPNSAGSPSFKKRKHVVLDEGPSSPKSVPDISPSDEACKTLFGSLASTEDPGDSDPFLLGIEEAHSSHEALCNLSYPDAQCRFNGLTLTELTNFHDVAAVRDFLPHAVERLLSSDHYSYAFADLQEKAMLVGRSQALMEVASSSISVELVDMKDFDPNVEHNFDRAIESFYQVKFPYVDLLVHYAGQSMGKLMTLKPPIILFGNASTAGPSASPFL